jgi:hypothetical protein
MPKLPNLTGPDVEIPNHKMVAKGTLRSLLRYAGLTVEQFVARFE